MQPTPSSDARARLDAKTTVNADSGYTTSHRFINLVGMALHVGLTFWFATKVAALIDEGEVGPWPWIVGAAIFCALPLTDGITGFVHWAADNWGTPDWPIAGGFVQPFRHHHDDPLGITRHGFVERHGDNCIASMPAFWWASLVDGDLAEGSFAWQIFWITLWVAVTTFVFFTALFHAWAHMKSPPAAVRLLQRMRLILSPEHHDAHHRHPYAKNYCITNGWMDGPMRVLRFFTVLEWILTKLSGVLPRHRQLIERVTAARTRSRK
jgi:Lipid desaturase domain